jgi:hypothetical protein
MGRPFLHRRIYSFVVVVMSRYLLIAMALVEAGTGIALLIAPSWFVALLLGEGLSSPQSVVLARIMAAALVSIAVACWRASNGEPSGRAAVVCSMLIYNLAVPVLLTWAAVTGGMRGIAIWPACALHIGLAVWCMLFIRSRRFVP